MKIGIIGAGFTGLAAAYYLSRKGHSVTVFERDPAPGGLAIGYIEKKWQWSLEKHYHHWFTNDNSVLGLAKEINYPVIITRPKTSSLVGDGIYQLDSPLTLLKFPKLSIIDRIRTGVAIGFLRFNPFWKPLEKFKAEPYLKSVMGKRAYQAIWEPLMVNKLGEFAHDVSLAWFWARVYKRTPSLAYPKGGFLAFANALVTTIIKQRGTVLFSTSVEKIDPTKNGASVSYVQNGKKQEINFDKVIVTLPSAFFITIAPELPKSYKNKAGKLKSIGAINLVMRLKKPFLPDSTYWLNICNRDFPILAIVEHTNFMNKKHYNNEALVYVGNYLPREHPFFSKSKEELLKTYNPFLEKINPTYRKNLIAFEVFKAPFAQPLIPPNYSSKVPSFTTPLPNVFLANIEQVYPWDRGTNYAVELGKKISNIVLS